MVVHFTHSAEMRWREVNISKELIIGLILALILFGPSRISQLGGALGKTIRDFRKSMEGEGDQPTPTKPSDSATPR